MTMRGAMTVDVEEYFHAAALSSAAPRGAWAGLPSRVEGATARVLDHLAAAQVRATFFTLGSVAARHPRLIRRIAEAGHEIASHGWDHCDLGMFTPATFRADVIRARIALEQAAGHRVAGFRAPNFSLQPTCWWAYDVLADTGHRYSSSLNPARYLDSPPAALCRPFAPGGRQGGPLGPLGGAGIVELPVTTLRMLGRRVHASGGGWFRALPYPLSRALMRRAQAQGAVPIFYFHPWEVDAAQPRLDVPIRARLRHYLALATMEGKLSRVLSEFGWDRMDKVFAAEIEGGAPAWAPPSVPMIVATHSLCGVE